jgi:hypothetical protein
MAKGKDTKSPVALAVTESAPPPATLTPAEPTEEELPIVARLLNHFLTPGSSLTSSVWTIFNVIMLWLFACWLLFVFSFPDNIHVWAFFVLGVGLLVTTNWFMSEIFKAGLDYDSTKKAAANKGASSEGKKGKAAPVKSEPAKQLKSGASASDSKKPTPKADAPAAKSNKDKKQK